MEHAADTSDSSAAAAAETPVRPAEETRPHYVNRELSWLDFNERVLQLAEDERTRLLERAKFLAIYTTNLDEFFMVRVGGLHDQVDAGVDKRGHDGLTPGEAIDAIAQRVTELDVRCSRLYKELRGELEDAGIRILRCEDCSGDELQELDRRFAHEILAQVLLIAVFRIAVAIAGSAEGTPSGMPGHLIGIVVRIAVVAALFGVVAHAVATLGRSTVAALGVIFGYLIVVEGFVAGLWTALQPRLLVRAAEVVISQQPLLGRAVITSDRSGNVIVQSQEVLLSVSEGWVVLGVWVVALTAAALLVFRARDVS